jgi:signal transduction histidine kinase/HAMP domain-containing protein
MIPRGIGPRINLALIGFVVLFGAAVAAIVLVGFRTSQDDAAARSREGLELFGERTMHSFAIQVGESVDTSGGQLTTEAAEAAGQLAANLPPGDAGVADLTPSATGERYDARPARLSDAWLGTNATSQAGSDLALAAILGVTGPLTLAHQQDAAAMYFIGSSGAVRYVPVGGLGDAPATLDPLSQPGYVKAAPEANPSRKAVWTAAHLDITGTRTVYTASAPVYVGGTFRGVVAIDVPQQTYLNRLNDIHPTDIGFTFGLDVNDEVFPNRTAEVVMVELAGGNPAMSDVVRRMAAGEDGVGQATLGGREYLISFAPLHSMGTSIALAAPIDSVTAVGDADGLRAAINHQGNRTLALTLGVLAWLLVVTLGAAAYLNRRFLLQPISRLVAGTHDVAAGKLDTVIAVDSQDELGALAGSFNEMTAMLRRRDASLRDEIAYREAAQMELSALFAGMNDAVFVLDRDGRYVRVAPTRPRTLRAGKGYFDGQSLHDHFPPELADRLVSVIRAALETGEPQSVEYPVVGTEGSWWLAASASALTADSVVWVARDITETMLSRQLLEERVAEQTRQLSTLLEMSQTVTTSLELQPLVDMILGRLRAAVPCVGISLLVRRGRTMEILDTPSRIALNDEHVSYPLDDGNPLWDLMERRLPVIIADVRGDEPLARAFRDLQGGELDPGFSHIRSFLSVPLATGERVFGTIALSRSEVDSFVERDAQVAMAFASQAAVAFQNAELLAQSERRARENEALSRIAASLTFDRPMGSTMDAVASAVLDATSAMACGVTVLTAQPGRLLMAGGAGLPEGYVEAVEASWDQGAPTESFDVARTGKPTFVPHAREDMLAMEMYAPLHKFLLDAPWDMVAVWPLQHQGQPVGALNVCYTAGTFLSEEEQRFLDVLAGQAAVAVENVRLYNEAQRRARESEALSGIAASLTFDNPLELTFGTLAERVVAGSDAIACAVILIDEQTGLPLMSGTSGLPDGYAEDMTAVWRNGVSGATRQAIETGELVMMRNGREMILSDPDYAAVHSHWENAPWDTVALMPMKYRGRTLGALVCYYARGVEPGPEELALLTAAADQTSVAVENARLFAHSESRVREVEAVAQVASNFTFMQSLESMMDAVCESVVSASRQAKAAAVTVANPETLRSVRFVGTYGLPDAFLRAMERAWRTGAPSPTQGALPQQQTRVIRNFRREQLRGEIYAEASAAIEPFDIETTVVVPMVYRTEPLGLLVVSYPTDIEPDQQELAFLEAIADQAAVAMENARLFSQGQSLAVVEERQRISRELHDSVSQALYGISLGAQTARELARSDPAKAVEPLDYVLSLAEAGITEMRALIFELRPEALATEGLLGALRKQAASVRARHGLEVETNFGDEPALALPVKEALYRIGQEALHNVVKHAGATAVGLSITESEGEVVLEVWDNGKGFDVADDYPGHLGLRSMRERTLHAGGHVTIESTVGRGTRIRARVPGGTSVPGELGGDGNHGG